MRRDGRHRPSGGIVHVGFLVLVLIGCIAGTQGGESDARQARHEDCAPIVWQSGMDPAGWELLKEQGYTDRPSDGRSALYPPGCESATL